MAVGTFNHIVAVFAILWSKAHTTQTVGVTNKELDGTDVVGKLVGKRQRFANQS
jgi:hypothetical protein